MPVSASGEKLVRSSRTIRISSSQSMSSGAPVTRPSSSASAASQVAADRRPAAGGQLVVAAEEADLQPGQVVAHRQQADVELVRAGSTAGGFGSSSSGPRTDPSSMNERSAASAISASSAGEAAARLDQRDQAARRGVEPLQRALVEVIGLVDQPVVAVREQELVVGERRSPTSPSVRSTQVPSVQLVGAQPQDQRRRARGSWPAASSGRPARAAPRRSRGRPSGRAR